MKIKFLSTIGIFLFFIVSNIIAFRGTSLPYISGDTFRSIANAIYDEEHQNLNILTIKNGDIIFIKGDYLHHFIERYLPKIDKHIILIVHNSDEAIPGKINPDFLNNEKIITVYAQNVENFQHQKLISIPIGIANRCWPHGDISIFNKILRNLPQEKPYLLYMNFSPSTYPKERPYVFDLFKNKPFCTISSPKNLEGYLYEMAQHKFTLSPRGNGIDCHRTWEALLVGSIPIIKSSALDSMYKDLPVLIIHDWKEVTEDFLHEKYAEFQAKKYNNQKAFAWYWLHKIQKKRSNWLKASSLFS